MNDEFEVTYSRHEGLRAKYSSSDHIWGAEEDVELPMKHCSWIEKLMEAEGRQGTGVIDFFLADPGELRRTICGADEYYQEDEDEEGRLPAIDEHNAYQVAYGPDPECRAATWW